MEMPDVVKLVIMTTVSNGSRRLKIVENEYNGGHNYHHDVIVEALKAENEELKDKLEKAKDCLGQISRMTTLPDHASNTITLVAAHQRARTTLGELTKK